MRTLPFAACLAGTLLWVPGLAGCNLFPFGVNQTPVPPPTSGPFPTTAPSTVGPEVRSEVLAAVQSGGYSALFTSYLINDGIGIFSVEAGQPVAGARRWGRDYRPGEASLDDQADVLVSRTGPPQARVVFNRPLPGNWIGDFPWRKGLVKKGFVETFHREAVFGMATGQWKLIGLSAARQAPGTSSVDIREVVLTLGSNSVRHGRDPVAVESLLQGYPGDQVGVTVVANTSSASAYAYLGGNRRQLLPYAGTDSRGARFEGTVTFPGQQDLGQIGFDLVASATLEVPAGLYDASIWGVPVLRKGGAL